MKKKRKTTVKEFAEKRVKAWNILFFFLGRVAFTPGLAQVGL